MDQKNKNLESLFFLPDSSLEQILFTGINSS